MTTLANKNKPRVLVFNGVEVMSNRCLKSDFNMVKLCKPYVDKLDRASDAFDAIDTDTEHAAEALLQGLRDLDTAWAQVVASWAVATATINPSLRNDMKRIIKGGSVYHIKFIRDHIKDAMEYLCDANGEFVHDEEAIRGAYEAQLKFKEGEAA